MTSTLDNISTAEYVQRLEAGQFAENPHHFRAAVRGTLPAEALGPTDRAQLMRLLVEHWGLSTPQIAEHTKWTPYTVDRIRDRLFLQPPTRRIVL